MTLDQIQTVADLLSIDGPTSSAAQAILTEQATLQEAASAHGIKIEALEKALSRLADAERRIRAAFICHLPACWEIVVGHHDTHRAPGMIVLAMGDEIRLLCAQVGVMVRVRVTQLPGSVTGYYKGLIQDLERSSARFHPGDGVMFSDDQVILTRGARRPRRPIPL